MQNYEALQGLDLLIAPKRNWLGVGSLKLEEGIQGENDNLYQDIGVPEQVRQGSSYHHVPSTQY